MRLQRWIDRFIIWTCIWMVYFFTKSVMQGHSIWIQIWYGGFCLLYVRKTIGRDGALWRIVDRRKASRMIDTMVRDRHDAA